jgi:hypothetical protein
MKTRIAIITACAGALISTSTLAHSQQIFDRWGNLRTETPGKNTKTQQTLPPPNQGTVRTGKKTCKNKAGVTVVCGDVNGDGKPD